MTEAFAHVRGVLATGLAEVTADPAALESSGWWAVVVTYEGEVTCARFADVRRAPHPRGPWGGGRDGESGSPPWTGRPIWRGSGRSGTRSPRGSSARPTCVGCFGAAVAGCGPDRPGARLARANPAPHAMTLRLPGLQIASASPELIAATFPPGSVTGAPESSALTLLDRLEPVPRGPYCGAALWGGGLGGRRRPARRSGGGHMHLLGAGGPAEIRNGGGHNVGVGAGPGMARDRAEGGWAVGGGCR